MYSTVKFPEKHDNTAAGKQVNAQLPFNLRCAFVI